MRSHQATSATSSLLATCVRRSAQDLASDVEHGSASIGVDSFAQVANRAYGKPCFLQSLTYRSAVSGLAGLHFASRELPRESALRYTSADE
jgi:hypothetical protein